MANQGTGVTLTKQCMYRGNVEYWSNTYWFFVAGPPAGDVEWPQIVEDLWESEKKVLPATTTLVQAYGYNDRTYKSHAVYDEARSPGTPGTFPPPVPTVEFAGDQAAMVGWKTDHKNSRGKWVYLRKYLHNGFVQEAQPDFLQASYIAALDQYAIEIQGFRGGLVPGPSKDDPTPGVYTITDTVVHNYVTTRTLKRRGKRPVPKG